MVIRSAHKQGAANHSFSQNRSQLVLDVSAEGLEQAALAASSCHLTAAFLMLRIPGEDAGSGFTHAPGKQSPPIEERPSPAAQLPPDPTCVDMSKFSQSCMMVCSSPSPGDSAEAQQHRAQWNRLRTALPCPAGWSGDTPAGVHRGLHANYPATLSQELQGLELCVQTADGWQALGPGPGEPRQLYPRS